MFKVVGADQDRRKMDIPETALLHITVEFAASTPVQTKTPSVAGTLSSLRAALTRPDTLQFCT